MKCPICGSDEEVAPNDTLLWCSECGGTVPIPGHVDALNEALRAASIEGQHQMEER